MLRVALPLLALTLAQGAEPQTPSERIAQPGEAIEWKYADQPKRVRYRVGEVVLEIEGEAVSDGDFPTSRPIVEVTMPDFAPIRLEGMESGRTIPHQLAVGRWGDGRPYVLFQSFSGGAHCCNHIQVALPERGRLVAIDLGDWDGEYLEIPRDVDGDGEIDFVFRDNRFLYAFTSYAGSRAPPQIFNIIGGEAVDVSAEARYAPLFRQAMAEDRAECLEGGLDSHGPCAAYVAEAARLGEFDPAWREVQRVYERGPRPDFPSEIRTFLEENGYLPQRT